MSTRCCACLPACLVSRACAQIEARTRQDIEEKNLQLRQLVGDSYRDLIDGTDQIIDISTKCHSILGSVLGIQVGLELC